MFTFVVFALVAMNPQDAPATSPTRTKAASAAVRESEIDLRKHFAGFDACFSVLNVHEHTLRRFNPKRCAMRFAPCSTFKVPHAAIALDLGVLAGPDHKRKWDGVQRWNEDWNRDHDLRSAMRDSTVWYFQDTAREIGPERMKAALAKLNYGNGDCSGLVAEFWLGRPLAISADEQLAFMNQLRLCELPLTKRAQQLTADLIIVERKDDRILHGKTGTRGEGDRAVLGWFVGWVEAGEDTLVFAANISAREGARGPKAREITRAVLAELLPEKHNAAADPSR